MLFLLAVIVTSTACVSIGDATMTMGWHVTRERWERSVFKEAEGTTKLLGILVDADEKSSLLALQILRFLKVFRFR